MLRGHESQDSHYGRQKMIGEWLIAATATTLALGLIVALPLWLERRSASLKKIDLFAEEFYASAAELASNNQTPVEILKLLAIINRQFASPEVVRKIVIAAFRGQLTEHAKSPPKEARAFLKAFNSMPEDLRTHFANAMVCSLLASAQKSNFWGFFFVRMMLFNPTGQKQSDAPTYASEIISSHREFMVPA